MKPKFSKCKKGWECTDGAAKGYGATAKGAWAAFKDHKKMLDRGDVLAKHLTVYMVDGPDDQIFDEYLRTGNIFG